MKVYETALFVKRRLHLSEDELDRLDEEIYKIEQVPNLGEDRADIRSGLKMHHYQDKQGQKILSYSVKASKIRLHSIDRLTLKI